MSTYIVKVIVNRTNKPTYQIVNPYLERILSLHSLASQSGSQFVCTCVILRHKYIKI